MQVLYEDNHIIIVSKAAGEIVQGDKTGDEPLTERVKAYIKERYAKPGARRIVNVKPFTVDTTARGSQAGYLADSLKLYFEEELMNGGKFIVYNENFAAQTGTAAVRPEFILTGKLREQNVRRDNGNFYKENSLLLKLTDVATGLDFWQKRVPLQKAVDKTNVMN